MYDVIDGYRWIDDVGSHHLLHELDGKKDGERCCDKELMDEAVGSPF